MQTGFYEKATCSIELLDQTVETTEIFRASLAVSSNGMAEITHYIEGVKNPSNKRTIFIPITRLGFFRGSGYAD
jgi:hypothetical protein